MSWGLPAFFVTLWHAVVMSTFSSVFSLSPLHVQCRGISWRGARGAVSGKGRGGGARAPTGACLRLRPCELRGGCLGLGLTLLCQPSSRALSTPGSVTTQAPAPSPIRAHPACPIPSPDTAVPSPKWPAPFGPPRSNTWGFPKPFFSVLVCLPLPQNILHSFIHSSKYL